MPKSASSPAAASSLYPVERRLRCGAVDAERCRGFGHRVALGEHALLQAEFELRAQVVVERVHHGLVVHREELLVVEVRHVIVDVVGLAGLVGEALALGVDPQRLVADQLRLARLDRQARIPFVPPWPT